MYNCLMEKSRNGQSPESQDIGEMAPETVANWIKKDVGTCLVLLKALYEDQDMLLNMAVFLQGRYTNAKNQEQLKQVE